MIAKAHHQDSPVDAATVNGAMHDIHAAMAGLSFRARSFSCLTRSAFELSTMSEALGVGMVPDSEVSDARSCGSTDKAGGVVTVSGGAEADLCLLATGCRYRKPWLPTVMYVEPLENSVKRAPLRPTDTRHRHHALRG